MPTCLSAILNLNPRSIGWRNFKLSFLFIFIPLFSLCQTTLTGLWTGVFSNDSATIRKEQSFEIVLTEYRGKVYGFSRSEFIVNDTLYYIVKRVKGTISGDVCEVKDDEIIAFNFPTRLDKGVKVTSHFYRNKVDSTWHLAGNWKTNQTKNFYAVTGKVDLAEEKDLAASNLFPHLDELNHTKEVAFYKDRKPQDVVMKTVEPQEKLFSAIRNEQQHSISNESPGSSLTGNVEVNTVQVSTKTAVKTQAETTKSTALDIPVKTETTQIVAQVNTGPAREKSSIENEEVKTEQQQAEIKPAAETVRVNTVDVKTMTAIKTVPELNKSATLDIPVKTETTSTTAQIKSVPVREKTNITTDELQAEQSIAQNQNTKPTTSSVKANTVNTSTTNPVISKPELNKSTALNVPVKTETPAITAQTNSIPLREKTNIATEKQQSESIAQKPVNKPAVKTTTVATTTTKPILSNAETKKSEGATIPVKTDIAQSKPNIVPETKKPASETVVKNSVPERSLEEIVAPAREIGGRKSEFAQTVNFKSDSLVLSLYDNGEIDGDTVSLYLNGVSILSRQGLKASAIKKTIYLPPGTNDEFTLVLFAENLGKYPPNTGLLVVRDGEDVYNVRFSADFQKNAGVVFRRQR